MTAIPVPPLSRIGEEEEEEIDDQKLKKNLLSEFDTPLVVSRRISRLSQKFENLPSEYAIKVFLRLRPFTEAELAHGEDKKCLKISSDRHILTAMAPKDSKIFKASNRGVGESVQHFTFTKIFDEATNQNDFYQQTAQPLVKEFVNGNNGLVFTYGVTNSGKTYTLQGTPGNEGIIPQAIENIFSEIGDKVLDDVPFVPKMGTSLCTVSESEKKKYIEIKKQVLSMGDSSRNSGNQNTILLDSLSDISQSDSCNTTVSNDSKLSVDTSELPVKYAMFVSFVELYCELVYDLLVPVSESKLRLGRPRPVLNIGDDKKGTSHIKGMREIQVNSVQEVLKILSAGQKNLHVAATKLNKDSSRSHCIFTITLVQVMDVPNPHGARISKISFCDLAGSERSTKTGEAGDRLKEAGNINNSLMKLGMCIGNLRHNQRYKNEKSKQRAVSFRESKLTRLFRNYLRGEGRACMIVNANMCATGFDETVHVLKFSAVAREVQIINKPRLSKPKKSNASFNDDILTKTESSRMTISWDNKLPPIEDIDETDENGSVDSEEESESESSELDETILECDVEYWKKREKKYEELIDMLRKELRRLREEMKKKEEDIRQQGYENMREQIVTIQKSHDDYVEDIMEIMTEEQERKKKVMVDLAWNDIKEVKDRYEKKMWDLTAKNTAIENELKSCRQELEEQNSSFNESKNKITSLEIKLNELNMDIEKKSQELEKKTQEFDSVKRQRRLSNLPQDEGMEDLVVQIEEGKTLIRSLMEEIDEKRQHIEETQEENDKLQSHLAKLQNQTKEIIEEEISKKIDVKEREITELKKTLNDLKCEITDMETKSELTMKEKTNSTGDIIVMEEGKTLKCTEGVMQYLLESAETKDEEMVLLKTVLEEVDAEKRTSENKLLRMNKIVEILQKKFHEISALRGDLLASKNELAQQNDCFKTWMDKQLVSVSDAIKSSMDAKDILLVESEKEKKENQDLKQELLKLTENQKNLNENLKKAQESSQKYDDLLNEQKAASTEKTGLQNKISELEANLEEKNKALVEIRSKFNEGKESNTLESENIKNLQEQVQEKNEILQELRSEMSGLNTENERLQKNIENEEQRNVSLQKTLKDFKEMKVVADEKLSSLEIEMNKFRQDETKLQEQFDKVQNNLKEQQSENNNLQEKSHKLMEEKSVLEKSLEDSQNELQKLENERGNASKENNQFDDGKSELENALERKEKDYENLRTLYNDFKSKTDGFIAELKSDHQDKLENTKKRFCEEIDQLKLDLLNSKKSNEATQEELKNFRDSRDKIVKALETQMSDDKVSNEKLRCVLDGQIAEFVKLKSQHAAVLAESFELKKQLAMKEYPTPSSSLNESSFKRELKIKLEPLTEIDSNEKQSVEKDSNQKSCPTTRGNRGKKRGSSISKRGKRNPRPATPLPEAPSDDEADGESPPKKSRVTSSSIKNEGVLDDSELLKETGNARCFPEPVLELDVTPSTSRKGMRTRRKVEKISDESEDPDFRSSIRRTTRRRYKPANTNNCNSNNEELHGSPVFSSVTKNISQVGTMIRNSPVASALKRFEEAISPANKSPKRAKKVIIEDRSRRGRRLIKLHPDDISSPLEASPDVGDQDRPAPVSDTPVSMLRRLRSRK